MRRGHVIAGDIASAHAFTLVETLLVLTIAIIITGGAIAFILRTPSSVVISDAAAKIEQLMLSAQSQAMLRGSARVLTIDETGNTLFITGQVEGTQAVISLESAFGADSRPNPQDMLRLESLITIEVTGSQTGKSQVFFYPDGTASGPEIILRLKDYAFKIKVSPLTGIVTMEDISDDF